MLELFRSKILNFAFPKSRFAGSWFIISSFQGTVKQVLTLPEIEGDPVLIDVRATFMCIATENGFVRIYDLSRRLVFGSRKERI
jgi:hypothetical protein